MLLMLVRVEPKVRKDNQRGKDYFTFIKDNSITDIRIVYITSLKYINSYAKYTITIYFVFG